MLKFPTIILLIFTLFWCENTRAQSCSVNYTYSQKTNNPKIVEFIPTAIKDSTDSVTYTWNFGDGTTQVLSNMPSHSFPNTSDTFMVQVILKVFDSVGVIKCRDTIKKQCITAQCKADATFFTNINDNTRQVNFIATYQDSAAFFWDFGDGKTSPDAVTSHFYETGKDTFNVCLTITVSDSIRMCVDIVCKDVIFMSKTCNLQADFIVLEQDSSGRTKFKNVSDFNNNPLVNYAWLWGDGTFISSNDSVLTHKFAKSGNYEVCLVAFKDPCYDTTCTNVRVNYKKTVINTYFQYPYTVNAKLAQTSNHEAAFVIDQPETPVPYTLVVFDVLGKELLKFENKTEDTFTFSINTLGQGTYYYTVSIYGQTAAKGRFLKY